MWLARPYAQVTLDAVAAGAAVSRQTLLRHFGSKNGLAMAVVDWQRPIEEALREVEPGDGDAAVHRLIARYEVMGDANIRVLELKGRVPAADHLISEGQQSHRAWIIRTFAQHLRGQSRRTREHLTLALYAATDVTVWKVLRRDFGRNALEVEAIVGRLVSGVLCTVEAHVPQEEP